MVLVEYNTKFVTYFVSNISMEKNKLMQSTMIIYDNMSTLPKPVLATYPFSWFVDTVICLR